MNAEIDQASETGSSCDERSNASEKLLPTMPEYDNFEVPLQNQLDYVPIDLKFEIKRSQLQVHQHLGEGFFSDVFLGTLSQSVGKMPVAVKMPKSIHEFNSRKREKIVRRQRKMLRDELKIWTYLQASPSGHENVLKLVGAITTSRVEFYIVTEYCEWGSLDKFLRKKFKNGEFEDELILEVDENDSQSTSPAQIWKIQRDASWAENFESRRENGLITTSDLLWFALQIARAMQFLTEKKVLHRDVALRNVLLKSDFTLKLADFGLSRRINDSNDEYIVLDGSVALPIRYLSPESVLNGRFTTESECWSFGVVIWELFTFALDQPYSMEFNKSNTNQVFFKFLIDYLSSGHRLIIPSIVPTMTKHLITKLWNEDPIQRPSFQTCRKLIRQELLQSCPNILFNQKTVPLHSSESSLFNIDDSISQETFAIRPRAHQKLWVRRLAGILVFITIAVAIILAAQLIVSNFSDINSASKSQVYLRFIHNFEGNYTLIFPLLKGVGAFAKISDIDAKSPVGTYIDFSTGTKHNVHMKSKTFMYWIDACAIILLQKTIILSLVESDGKMLLITYSMISLQLSYIDEHSIDLRNNTLRLRSKIHEDDGKFYLICIMGNRNTPYEATLFVMEISVANNGTISSISVNKQQPWNLTGTLDEPFLRSGVIYWLLRSASLENDTTFNVSRETTLLIVHLFENETKTELIANYKHCHFNSDPETIWHAPVQIEGYICYIVVSKSRNNSHLCYIDFERMSWDSLPLDLRGHEIIQDITVARYTNESILLHSLTESLVSYIVIVNFTALRNELESFIVPINASIKTHPEIEWEEDVAIHPNGKRALMLCNVETQIADIDLTNGSLTLLENSDWTNNSFYTENILVISHSIQTQIILVVRKKSTRQFFLASYQINNKSVDFAEWRMPTGLFIDPDDKYQNSNYFQKDRNGQWYFVVYWLKWRDKRTHFHLLAFNVASNGNISCKILFNNQILVGIWTSAFVFNGAINWLPGSQKMKYESLISRFYLKVFFGTGLNATVKLSSSLMKGLDLSMKEYYWSNPVVINELIFFYILKSNDTGAFGQIIFIDNSRKTWHMLRFRNNLSVKSPKKLMSSDNNLLFALAKTPSAVDILDVSELVMEFSNRLS